MIFKHREAADQRVLDLEDALRICAGEQRKQIERELAIARAGLKGEQEAAYHIDFHLKDSKNWAVIHDLRLKHNGRVAQIDHLLISRLMEIYVIESKSFQTKVRFANGGWERFVFNNWEGIPSPSEQNDRHILVLQELLEHHKIAPVRFGLSPSYINIVLVQPSCSVVGKIPPNVRVYRMDALVNQLQNENPSPFLILKAISQDTLHSFGRELASFHEPPPRAAIQGNRVQVQNKCENCGGVISKPEIDYCISRAQIFAGLKLCRKCQRYCPSNSKPIVPEGQNKVIRGGKCSSCCECGVEVAANVVAFCRVHARKFNGRVLCRSCQVVMLEKV